MTPARTEPDGATLVAAAEEALRQATGTPGRATTLAEGVLARARVEGDAAAASLAEQALGLAAREFNRVDEALAHLRAAVSIAERAGLAERAAEARSSMAPTLFYAGRTAAALREADRAAQVLRGPSLARLMMQRSGMLQLLGRLDEALAMLRPAAAAFRRIGDGLWEARLLNNRGILHGSRGAFAAADRDFRRAAVLFSEVGDEVSAALVLCNKGWLSGRRGDVPAALAYYDECESQLRALGMPLGIPMVAKCEVLLAVRLVAEARTTGEAAAEELARNGMMSDVPEAQLRIAHAALLGGDPAAAAALAARAARTFARHDRQAWAAVARWTMVRARWEAGSSNAATQRAALEAAEALAAGGREVPALEARIVAARIALDRNRVDEAEALLAPAAARASRRGPAELRTRAWYALALLRAARHDGVGAERALQAGCRVLDSYRASLGATELRASVSGHGEDLARLGLSLALAARRTAGVFQWAERGRAAALRLRPVRPPDDDALTADLAQLRQVTAELEQAASPAAVGRLTSRLVELEEAVRRRSRRTAGSGAAGALPGLGEVAAALDRHVLVEIIQPDGDLVALVVRDGKAVLRPLAAAADALREVEQLRFALRRLAFRRGSPASLAAATAAATASAARLDELLLAPLGDVIGERPLVIAPPGRLHALPWSVLPSCRGRPVSVAPSAALWLQARRAGADPAGAGRRVALVAGPELAHAAAEIAELGRGYAGATVLVGDQATASAFQVAVGGADLAHVAAHGRFRADNPLFSSLLLADGPLTVYDLEGLRRAPPLLVLSACDSGLSSVCAGDELMGLSSALFTLGTGALVASVGPVPDDATRALMGRFHRNLRGGSGPAEALASAQGEGAVGEDPAWVAAASFVCFGAG